MESPVRTILVADDEYSIIETLTDILAWEGYNVISAPNGERALHAAQQSPPQLALIDFMMPVMDGVALAKNLRKLWPELPIIIMTAAPAALPKNDGLWNETLPKPFELDALVETVKRVLEQSGA